MPRYVQHQDSDGKIVSQCKWDQPKARVGCTVIELDDADYKVTAIETKKISRGRPVAR